MILTGLAKEDFEKWYSKGITDKEELYNIIDFYENKLANSCQNALIIDWFVQNEIWNNMFYYEYRKTGFKDYTLAATEAIKKANEIYNLKQ